MFPSSKSLVALFAVVLLFGANIAVHADTIKLKDGSVIKGKIVDFKNQQMTVVRTGTNNRTSQITVEADEVESIEFDSIDNLVTLINTARPGASANTAVSTSNINQNPSVPAVSNGSVGNQPAVVVTAPTASPRPVTTNPVSNNGSTAAAAARPTANGQPISQTTGGLSQVINSQPASSSTNSRPASFGNGRFVPVSVKVLADNTANGWTNTGLVVKKGQRIRISANGRISLGSGKYATPAGIGSLTDNERLMKTEPTGALIAVIGDDNNDFIFIGSNRDFEAPRDGTLFLGVNEGNLEDNSGAFDITVEAEASNATAKKN